jgi:selenocysteine-specific elongation factor
MTVVIGTAGHIDHGKTTLLRALTGIDADRLPEERARGMTIDVGYAHMALADGTELDFVDVPGHDRLVGNMLVGAGEIDAALLVIAADDGPRAQTLEHLELLDAIGIEDGVVVVTKIDLVGADRVDEVVAEASALLLRTSLRGWPVVRVSAVTRDGIEALRGALVDLRDRAQVRAIREAAAERDVGSRLAIDRVFSIRGRGTVVTGSLRGLPLERGAILRVVPAMRDRTVRVREVQVHGRAMDRAGPGRVALNVAGDGIEGLERGMILTTDAAVVASDRLLVALRPVADVPGGRSGAAGLHDLPGDRTPIAIHLGTVRVAGVVGRSGRDNVQFHGGEGSAVLRLDRPIAVAPGDRFVLRRASPAETLAGGRILDPRPPRGIARRRASPERLAALAVARTGSEAWQTARLELHGVLGGSPPALAADVAAAIDQGLVAGVEESGSRTAPLLTSGVRALRRLVSLPAPSPDTQDELARRIVDGRLDHLIATGQLTRRGDRVALPGAAAAGPSPALVDAMDRLVASLASVVPPALGTAAREAGCPSEGIRILEAAGRIVRLDDDLAWALPTYRDLAARAVAMATQEPLTPAAFRDATGTSRKYVMAILEDLDRRAILRRTPAGHLPGPRAPRARAADPAAVAGTAAPIGPVDIGPR